MQFEDLGQLVDKSFAMKMSETFGGALPKEIERVQELITLYESVPNGIFAATMMKQDVRLAYKAMIEGDLPTMLAVYQDLKTYT